MSIWKAPKGAFLLAKLFVDNPAFLMYNDKYTEEGKSRLIKETI